MFARFRISIALAALIVSSAAAQTQSGITGTVTDRTGAVIVGATVLARNTGTGVGSSTLSNGSGAYNFPFLAPGQYEVSCELAGFKKFVRTGLVLETGLTSTVDIRLDVGEVTETVSVNAAAPLLQSESSAVGQFIERATVAGMPAESRRSASLVRLMGNVVYSMEDGAEQIPRFSMAGGRSLNQMWQLDGAVAQNMALGVPQLSLNPPAEALQEFRAEANNYTAEFGRSGNGLILMTTRSGTNQFHGAAYEFLRNDKLDTRTFFSPGKAPLRYNVFGGSVGGPIIRDRTFFFVNYEGSRRINGLTFSNVIVPHPAEVRGDFSARKDLAVIDPLTRQPFPGNRIPADRMDPIGRAFAGFYPAPNMADDITGAPRNNYIKNVSDALTQDFVTTRVDHTVRDQDRVSGRFSWVRAPQETAAVYPAAFADYRAGTPQNRHANVVGSWLHNFRPNLINDARYVYGNRMHIDHASGTGSGKNGELGLNGVDKSFFATVTITGLSQLGSNGNQLRIQTPILTQQLIENLTWIKGKHQVKTGVEYRYSSNEDNNQQQAGGRFDFSGRATGTGLASLLLGWTTTASLNSTDILNTRTDYWGVFVQDDWKVTPTLTLNLGLRWDLDTPRWETHNRQSGFDLHAINPVAGVPGIVTFSGRDGRSKYAHDFDSNNFGPRVGFAWKWGSSVVVRGGYGISYNGEYAVAVPFVMFNGFGLNGAFSSPDGGFTPAFLFRNGLPPVTREPLTPAFGSVGVGDKPRLDPDFIQQNEMNGYAQHWNLTIQKQLRGNMVFEAAYLANVGHKLGGPNINLNMIPLVNGRGPVMQDQLLRPFPQFNNVTQVSPPWGNSTYHSLNLKVEKRYSNGLNFLTNYTWSKFLDDIQAASELSGGLPSSGYTHIELRRLDKSYSGNDIRHRLITSSVYELPFGHGRHWTSANRLLRAVAGDWGLGLIAEFRSGQPYGAVEQTNVTNTFSAGQRPNLLRNPDLDAGRPRSQLLSQYFDTSAFVAPGVGVFGNAPRYVAPGPGFIGVDLSVHKRWAFMERWGLVFRGDFYNLLNRPNFANPNNLRGRADFGSITSILSGSTGRQIQLSMRLEF